MVPLKSALLALLTFAALLPAVVLFWGILLGPVMEPVWRTLPDGWAPVLGAALLAVAALSGLAVYFVVLARQLSRRLGVPPGRVRWHLATAGVLPPALALGAAWLVLQSLRFGW